MVLLKVRATAMYVEVITEKPKYTAIPNPITDVNTTWPTPVIIETFPTSFIILGFRFNPTRKRRRATPISANVEIETEESVMLMM